MVALSKKRPSEYAACILPPHKKLRTMSTNQLTRSPRKRSSEQCTELHHLIPVLKKSRIEATNIISIMSSSSTEKRSYDDSLPSSTLITTERIPCIAMMINDTRQNKRKRDLMEHAISVLPDIKKSRSFPIRYPCLSARKKHKAFAVMVSLPATKRAKSTLNNDHNIDSILTTHNMIAQVRLPDPSIQNKKKVILLSTLKAMTQLCKSNASDCRFKKTKIP